MKKYQLKIMTAAVVLCFFLLLILSANKIETEKYQAGSIAFGQRKTLDLERIVSSAERAMDRARFQELEAELKETIKNKYGQWSIYVKNLSTGDSISINADQPIYAASLSKLFVMEYTFANMKQVKANGYGDKRIESSLRAMITVSDNEAYNNLIRMNGGAGSFAEGCRQINAYLENASYKNTGVYHTLHPCSSPYMRISGTRNHTTAEDCGLLLEAVYNGTCVSKEASEQMLNLLLKQQRTGKIPAGLPKGTKTANKTGETDSAQHDAAIIFGPETDYVFCVMTYNAPGSINAIQKLSGLIYEYLE